VDFTGPHAAHSSSTTWSIRLSNGAIEDGLSISDIVNRYKRGDVPKDSDFKASTDTEWRSLSNLSNEELKAITIADHAAREKQNEIQRRFPRAPLSSRVIAHDDNRYTVTTTYTISEGGCFLVHKDVPFSNGDVVKLFIESAQFPIPVVCKAEVICQATSGGSVGYCCRFVEISDTSRQAIVDYTLNYSLEHQ
jgi:c-di-GMP-binding flagellar brake protein YcgR